jgi:hypothetical protein
VFGDCLSTLFVAGAVVAWRTHKVQWPDVGRSRQATDADRKSDTRKNPGANAGAGGSVRVEKRSIAAAGTAGG